MPAVLALIGVAVAVVAANYWRVWFPHARYSTAEPTARTEPHKDDPRWGDVEG